MRVLVIGGTGMLGHKLVEELGRQGYEVWASVRCSPEKYEELGLISSNRLIGKFDVRGQEAAKALLDEVRPDVAINAAGIVKQHKESADSVASIEVNSLFPHKLAAEAEKIGTRVITISTDCVFSGEKGCYIEYDIPDAADLYGRSKLLGELAKKGTLTIRTSMIGRELVGHKGLVEWFLASEGTRVKGFSNAFFSGMTTGALSRIIGDAILTNPKLEGVFHLSAEKISKLELLEMLKEHFSLNIEIDPVREPRLDRSLNSLLLKEKTGITVPSWTAMIQELAEEDQKYKEWRQKSL